MKKRIVSIICIFALCMSVIVGTIISADATTCSYNKISIPNSYTIGVGETVTIPVTSSKYTYVQAAASDSSNGIISGISVGMNNPTTYKAVNGKFNIQIKGKKAGTAYVYVTDSFKKGYLATCKITVKKAPTSVSLNKTSLTLGVGEKYDLNYTLSSGSASYGTKFTSSNSGIATVNASSGLVTAKKVGTAKITVKTFNGKTKTCTVAVKKAPTKVTLNKTSITLKKGQTYTLVENTPGAYANPANIKCTSSNSKVATATRTSESKYITIKAINKGTSTITVTVYNGKKATCKVTVK